MEIQDRLRSIKELANFFEKVAKFSGNAKASSNWVMVELLRELNLVVG